MANPVHVAKVKEGWTAAMEWFHAEFRKPDVEKWIDLTEIDIADPELARVFGPGTSFCWVRFDGADLHGIDISDAVIWENEFDGTNLAEAKLSGSELCYSTFIGANLRGAHLSRAALTGVRLVGADLAGANLQGACLYKTELIGATLDSSNLSQADFTDAVLGYGSLQSVDLSTVEGLNSVTHVGPSAIDAHTAETLDHKLRRSFLAGCGIESIGKDLDLTEVFAVPRSRNCHTLFEHCDEILESRIRRRLLSRGLPVWRSVYMSYDTTWWQAGSFSRPQPETTILICSHASLRAEWLLKRVEKLMENESSGSHGQLLFPIAVDNYLLKEWSHPLRERILDREIIDFHRWGNRESFRRSLHRLIDLLAAEC